MEEIQTTLNDSRVSARLPGPARKPDLDLKLILRELMEYRRLKRAERGKHGV